MKGVKKIIPVHYTRIMIKKFIFHNNCIIIVLHDFNYNFFKYYLLERERAKKSGTITMLTLNINNRNPKE